MEGNHFDKLQCLRVPCSCPHVQHSNADVRSRLSKLTIFYEDNVYVYPDISPEKVKSIMAMAENECLNNGDTEPALKATVAVRDTATNHYLQAQLFHTACPPMNSLSSITAGCKQDSRLRALAQARKASLQRFLHRRKHRLETLACFHFSKTAHDQWPSDLFSAQVISLQDEHSH